MTRFQVRLLLVVFLVAVIVVGYGLGLPAIWAACHDGLLKCR